MLVHFSKETTETGGPFFFAKPSIGYAKSTLNDVKIIKSIDLGRGVPLGSCRGYPVYDKNIPNFHTLFMTNYNCLRTLYDLYKYINSHTRAALIFFLKVNDLIPADFMNAN